jgi:hypothetical protein
MGECDLILVIGAARHTIRYSILEYDAYALATGASGYGYWICYCRLCSI